MLWVVSCHVRGIIWQCDSTAVVVVVGGWHTDNKENWNEFSRQTSGETLREHVFVLICKLYLSQFSNGSMLVEYHITERFRTTPWCLHWNIIFIKSKVIEGIVDILWSKLCQFLIDCCLKIPAPLKDLSSDSVWLVCINKLKLDWNGKLNYSNGKRTKKNPNNHLLWPPGNKWGFAIDCWKLLEIENFVPGDTRVCELISNSHLKVCLGSGLIP